MTTVKQMAEMGTIPMPTTDAEWEAARDAKRATNVANAREVLKKNGIHFYYEPGSLPVVFEIEYGNKRIRYLPESGQWYFLGSPNNTIRFGVRNLVKFINGVLK